MQSLLTITSFVLFERLSYTSAVAAKTVPPLLSRVSRRADADADKDVNTILAAPIIAEPSQHWEGVDGIWSTFIIRIGTPESTYRVLPVTSWQETWVVYGAAAGICNATAGVRKGCQEARGGAFDVSKSTTWKDGGQHQLGLDENMGMEGVGQYGFDTVGLGYSNSTGPTLSNQIVSAIVSDDYWLGILGLGFQPTNFSGYNDPQASFSETLYTSGEISSRSWSYTAGAYYRLKSVFGSLIFGGYDASRFTPNNITFTMTGDNLRDVVVTVRSITWNTRIGQQTLMSDAEFAFIDSAVPELWLPVSVCEEFEKAFGLQYDNASTRYLLDDSSHMKLQEANPTFTITLANHKDGGATMDIILPYAAFDLNVTAPILGNRTEWYFPIRRGTEGSYTLGRTFLQEAYVTTHYPSRTFNVSQCVFEDGLPEHIIALPDTLSSNTSQSHSGSGSGSANNSGSTHRKLGAGAIAGIVIGTLALLLALGLLFFFFRRRRHKNHQQQQLQLQPFSGKDERQGPLASDLPLDVVEIDSGKRLEGPGKWHSGHGEQATSFTNEVPGQDSKVELDGNPIMVPQELEAEVPFPAGSVVHGQSKTPMAELGREERGLGEGGAACSGGREGEDIVSPVTDRNRSSFAGTGDGSFPGTSTAAAAGGTGESHRRGSHKERPSILVSTPSGNEGNWSPTSPVQRTSTRGSRFQEQLD